MTSSRYPTGFAAIWDPRGMVTAPCRTWAEASGGVTGHGGGPLKVFSFNAGSCAPKSWDAGSTSGVFWGELYNVSRIRYELLARGMDLAPAAAPEELLPAGYAVWGDELFERLQGLYCVVLWDGHTRKLVMYRDGSGSKGLYWHEAEGWAAVATRLDILVGVPAIPKRIGPAGLHEYLRFLDISAPSTIYQGIKALEPGMPAHFSGDGLEYAGPKTRKRPSAVTSEPPFDACVERLDEALRASVAERLEQEGPTGLFLSGGIDSALVGAVAASLRPGAIEAFTVGFTQRRFDEAPVAASIAEHLGIRHHALEYTDDQYREAFEVFAAGVDLPFADPAALPTLLLFRDCHKHVRVVLDGTGADTLIGVMPARHIRIATQYAARVPRGLRQAIGSVMRWLPGASAYSSIMDFDAPEDLLIRWKGWSRLEIEALCGTKVSLDETRFFQIYKKFSRGEHFDCYSALLGNLPDDRIHQAAELESLQVRFPYWDSRIEELVKGLPQAYRYTSQEPKRLLRALLERYLPRSIWDRPKHGFDFPFISFLQQDDHALVRRYLDPDLLRRHGIVDAPMVGEYARSFMAGNVGLGFRIWALVVLFAWLEHHYAAL